MVTSDTQVRNSKKFQLLCIMLHQKNHTFWNNENKKLKPELDLR